MADPFYFDDEREPEDDGRPQLPRKPRYCDDEQPAGPRLTFAHERARATDGIYVSPPAAPERLGADLRAWGADAGKAAIAAHAAARAGERRRQTEQAAGQWRTSVFEVPGEQQPPKRADLLDAQLAVRQALADKD